MGRRPEGASNGGSMCSAECTLCPNTADRKNSKYYALADITLLPFDVRAFAHTDVRIHAARATSIPKRSKVNAIAIAMSYSVVRHVYHGASSRRDRELKYSSQPIAKNQATMTPKAWISTGDSSLCGHLIRSSL